MDSKKESNKFGFRSSITESELLQYENRIDSERPSDKYRKELPNKGIDFDIEDFIELKVQGYKKELKLKTFCSVQKGEPKAIVFFIHGLGSHSKRASHVGKELSENGFFYCTFDHREHGYSCTDLGYVYSLDDLINDSFEFTKKTMNYFEEKYKTKVPVFLIGISMGGLICHYLDRKIKSDGVVYLAPAFDLRTNFFQNVGLSFVSFIYPSMAVPQSEESRVSKNPVFKEDLCPIMEKRPPAMGTVGAIKSKVKEFLAETNKSKEKSFIMVMAGVEKLVNNIELLKYYETSSVKDKSLWYYPNMWHGIYVEEEMEDLMPRLIEWLNNRIV